MQPISSTWRGTLIQKGDESTPEAPPDVTETAEVVVVNALAAHDPGRGLAMKRGQENGGRDGVVAAQVKGEEAGAVEVGIEIASLKEVDRDTGVVTETDQEKVAMIHEEAGTL